MQNYKQFQEASPNLNVKRVNDFIHFLHLTESSYARHMALGEFYEGMPGLLDTFSEAVLVYPIELSYAPPALSGIAEDQLKSLLDKALKLHSHLSVIDEYALTNALEDIMTFTKGVLYKLVRLS